LRFTMDDSKTGSQSLWEVASDGTGLRPLLPGWSSPPSECCGSWTPDGSYFVFQSQHAANTNSLWAIREKSGFQRSHNSEPVQLTTGPNNMFSPVPSRDGKRLFAIQGASRANWCGTMPSRSSSYLFLNYQRFIIPEGYELLRLGIVPHQLALGSSLNRK